MPSDVVVLVSGGMDSATLLALAVDTYNKVVALSVDYAQRHKKELDSACMLTRYYQVPHTVIDISTINSLISTSALTSELVSVPHGHYADPNMRLTVVPGRNTILLSIAAAMAAAHKIGRVAYAAHKGDHTVYPDCRPEYVNAVQTVFNLFDYNPVTLWTPFIHINKSEILTRGLALCVPYEMTWTCYEGQTRPCGKCGACVERLEAFADNNEEDPLIYEHE